MKYIRIRNQLIVMLLGIHGQKNREIEASGIYIIVFTVSSFCLSLLIKYLLT